jgi:subfamily B ATP-binding cassette protein MsbA
VVFFILDFSINARITNMIKNAATPQNPSSLHLIKRLIGGYVRPHWGAIARAVFFMAIAGAMTGAIAQLMQPILDDVLGQQKKGMITPVAISVFVAFAVRGVATFAHTIIMVRVSQTIVGEIQKQLFRHFMHLDLAFFHAHPSGQLLSRVVNDVNVVRMALSDTLTGIGKSLTTLIFLVAVMVYQDWQLSLAAFVVLPFAAGFIGVVGRKIRKISRDMQSEMGGLSGLLSQIFQGIRQVKAYGMEDHEQRRAGKAIDKVRALNIKAVRVSNMTTPVNEILIGLILMGVILYGGTQAAAGAMTPGQLGAFLAAFIMAYEPMKKLSNLSSGLQMGLGAASRVFDMMDLQPSIATPENPEILSTRTPELVFHDVQFQYQETDRKALNKINFTAKPGGVTALVGPSGGGKSTIINLIPRFYDVESGAISINGVDIRRYSLESLRSHIALVSQDITIFDESVAANIGYSKPGATQAEIEAAAKDAFADDFIRALPQGYATVLGEDGVKLSGGQRQRIAIARAILRDAPVLLLDEATSALDNESEKAVQDALKRLEKGRTTIVIAHRLSTVQHADQILVLQDGIIVESGRHADLLAQKGVYASMVEAGLKG